MAQSLTRRNFLKLSATGALGVAGVLIPAASLYSRENDRNRQPNIIMYISDDHGLDFLGC